MAAPARAPEDNRSPEERLADHIGALRWFPLEYVIYAFPWRSDPEIQLVPLPEKYRKRFPGVEFGPDLWACEMLDELGEEIRKRAFDPKHPRAVDPIREAISSGHGIGKSAMTAWLTSFLLDTRPHSMGTVTANTGEQLRAKTWARISKWKRKSITFHWYEISDAEMWIRAKEDPRGWRCDGLTWTVRDSEAFAGQHAADSSPWYIFDEASAIADIIFEVAEGGMTDGEPFYFLFGNPTRGKGRFYRAFHKDKHRFINRQIDSRTVFITNKRLIEEWIDDYGEDSDFVRIRVRGVFPRGGSQQLIPHDVVRRAQLVTPVTAFDDPLVIGVDVALFGSDEIVFCPRRGRDARSLPWRFMRGLDPTQTASRLIEYIEEFRAMGLEVAAVFVDNMPAGVVSTCQNRGYDIVEEVGFGWKASRPDRHKNRGTEMWCRGRDWMKNGGAIPDDPVLQEQLTAREYDYTSVQVMFLMPKDEMEESPDRGDAFMLTFAEVVAPRHPEHQSDSAKVEYDPHANM